MLERTFCREFLHVFMSYQKSIAYLYGLQKFGIKFGLENISRLLAHLGSPHQKQAFIHIAGTNGKGSTASFLASILSKAGYKTGLYTSPHLTSFTERIRINGRQISKKDVARLTGVIKIKSAQIENLTYFEFVTAMALLYFEEHRVDFSLLEVGMGGRLDATNVVRPLISIITNISKEHEFYLGNTLKKIAYEKAGIIKKNGVLITGATQPSVLSVFKKRCQLLKSSYYQLGRDFTCTPSSKESFNYHGITSNLSNIRLGLRGDYQVRNAGLALAAVDILRDKHYPIEDAALYDGLRTVSWPGRLEIVNNVPLVILDGAHNADAMKNLRLALFNNFDFKRLLLVLGIMEDKEIKKMLCALVPSAHQVVLCKPLMDRAASTQTLATTIKDLQVPYHQIDDVKNAVRYALTLAREADLICVTGSLFTVGEARTFFFKKAP
jgi:dihydrofolate synthase/folylpolyglutamate synthase